MHKLKTTAVIVISALLVIPLFGCQSKRGTRNTDGVVGKRVEVVYRRSHMEEEVLILLDTKTMREFIVVFGYEGVAMTEIPARVDE